MQRPFVARVAPPAAPAESARWFIFREFALLVHEQDDGRAALPYAPSPEALGVTAVHPQYLGYLETETGPLHCYAAEVAGEHDAPPEGMAFHNLRALFGRFDDETLGLAGRAMQIVDWNRTHQFCGRCGRPTVRQSHERARRCPHCGLTSYPRIAPAVIVSVERRVPGGGAELLLAHNRRHPAGFYSVLAGFVEPGETLEACVQREVCEEVGITIHKLRYFGSQPWPFPHSLMIAFTAEYAGGEITLEEAELDHAAWFPPHALPQVPPPVSIARRLIDAFVARHAAPGAS